MTSQEITEKLIGLKRNILEKEYLKPIVDDDKLLNNLSIILSTGIKHQCLWYPAKNQLNRITSIQEYINKFVSKYINSYNNRPSKRETGSSVNILPDPTPIKIFDFLTKDFIGDSVVKISSDIHQLYMNIENIVGEVLEEFIDTNTDSNWVCCWGTTLTSIDFCTEKHLLQVKNSFNSENSSSSRIREGTEIKKWYRRPANGNFDNQWDILQKITNSSKLTETNFLIYFEEILKRNPNLLTIPESLKNKYEW